MASHIAIWIALAAAKGGANNTPAAMANAFMFFGAIAILLWIVAFLDWWGRRKDARQRDVRS